MKIASNVTEKNFKYSIQQICLKKALMLEFNIAFIAYWYFGLDYVNCK